MSFIRFILYFLLFYFLYRLIRNWFLKFMGTPKKTEIYEERKTKKKRYENIEEAKYQEIKPEDEKKKDQ